MHDIKSNFDKVFQTIKSLNITDLDQHGNIPRPGVSPLFTDIEVVSLVLTAEYMSLDSENWLFKKINSDYKNDFPHLIDRTRYNRRKRQLFLLLEKIRNQLASKFLEFEDYFIIDSMPLEVCKIS
ncbi:IS982 family transposase, partial [Reichenbachiella sp. MALMAid0571]